MAVLPETTLTTKQLKEVNCHLIDELKRCKQRCSVYRREVRRLNAKMASYNETLNRIRGPEKMAALSWASVCHEHDKYRARAQIAEERVKKAFYLGIRWQANQCTPEELKQARKELDRPEVQEALRKLEAK